MAKVLWVQNLWIEYMGIMSITALLKKHGHEVDIIFDSKEGVVDYIRRFQPSAIAFSLMSVQWKWAKEMIAFIKEQGIKTPIIVGGVHSTLFPEETMEYPWIDVICLNEGEAAMLEFVEAVDRGQDDTRIGNLWVRRNGTVVRNPTRPKMTAEELNALPFPDRDLYKKYEHFQKYPFEIFVGSRGCPFTCTFCEVPEINEMYGGKRVVYTDPVRFVDEIEDVKKRGLLDNKLVMFTDSTFNSHRKWFLQFLEEYRKRINVPFSCNLRVDLVDERQVQALAQSNCDNVRFGVESGDDNIRNQILHKQLTDEQIVRVSDLLHKYNIPFLTFNLFGNPEETLEQAWKTIRINQLIKPAATGCYVFMLFPKLAATNYALSKGLIEESDFEKIERHPYNLHLSILRQPEIKEICNLQKFSILLIRFPFLEPIVRWLIRLPPNEVFNVIYSVSQVLEFRKWSSKTTIPRILYEALLNYQALVETSGDKKSLLRRISLALSHRRKKKMKPSTIELLKDTEDRPQLPNHLTWHPDFASESKESLHETQIR